MAKNLVSDLILAPLAQILDMLDTFASYHCMQVQGKLLNQT